MQEIRNFGQIPEIQKPETQVNAEKRANEIVDRFTNEGIKAIEKLIEEVHGMKLASRFRENIDMEGFDERTRKMISRDTQMIAAEKGEPGLKRRQLIRDLNQSRDGLIIASGRLKNSIMDIEASKTE